MWINVCSSLVRLPPFSACNSQVDAVVVGADRVVANGDTANKIGTYALSIIAKHHKVGFSGQLTTPESVSFKKVLNFGWCSTTLGVSKCGTSHAYNSLCQVPFFIAAPSTTLDPAMPDGSHIVIEQRPADEITHFRGQRVVKEGIQVGDGESSVPWGGIPYGWMDCLQQHQP